MGPIRVRGVPTLAGGRYVSLAFLWGRRWRSLRGTINVKGVPEWAGGRYAIPPHSSPFLCSSSLHPPQAGSYLILPSASILASPSSLLPPRSSLLLHFGCERDRFHNLGGFGGVGAPKEPSQRDTEGDA